MLKKTLLAAATLGLCACSTDSDGVNRQGPYVVSSSGVYYSYSDDPEAPNGAILAGAMSSAPLNEAKTLTRIVFASCAQQREDQSIWDQIVSENPDLTLYIGDNVYGDVRSNDPALPELKAAYMRLAQSKPFARARAVAPMLTTWDDHDMGMNDAGGEFALKEQSEALYEYVWALDDDDPRRSYPGVYGSWTFGEPGSRVQIIMLDTRFFRSPLKPTDEFNAPGKERWLPDPDPSKTMLGGAQWAWLEGVLKEPADLRLLVSSVQVLSEGHGWEAWKMLPAERNRLFGMIDEADANGLIVLSGDRHSAALYRKEGVIDYPLFEATSSSLNLPVRGFLRQDQEFYQEPDPNRMGDMYIDANYGLLEIDWENRTVTTTIRSETGEIVRSDVIALNDLR